MPCIWPLKIGRGFVLKECSFNLILNLCRSICSTVYVCVITAGKNEKYIYIN